MLLLPFYAEEGSVKGGLVQIYISKYSNLILIFFTKFCLKFFRTSEDGILQFKSEKQNSPEVVIKENPVFLPTLVPSTTTSRTTTATPKKEPPLFTPRPTTSIRQLQHQFSRNRDRSRYNNSNNNDNNNTKKRYRVPYSQSRFSSRSQPKSTTEAPVVETSKKVQVLIFSNISKCFPLIYIYVSIYRMITVQVVQSVQ